MSIVLQELWGKRDQFPIGSRDWCRAWAKRALTAPTLAQQFRIQRRMRRRGANLSTNVFISDDGQIQGKMNKFSIGEQTFIGRVHIAIHDEVRIGCNVCINDGAMLLTASHDIRSKSWKVKTGEIVVGDFVWIATNAIILPGVHLGRGAVVGAGAVVSKNVPPNALAIGNPAVIREHSRAEILDYKPLAHLGCFTAWRSLQPSEEE